MIAIIDYDAGNLKSVEKALVSLGEEVLVSRDSSEILQADKVILPGVGSFGDAMNNLDKFGLVDTIKKVTGNGTPFLGICLGLQLLFKESDETPGAEGLDILPGKILKIPAKDGFKIPYMGWNACAVISGKVVEQHDLGTHTLFIAEVVDAKLINENAPLTYADYQTKVKPKAEPKAQDKKIVGWRCRICNYVYEGSELPADFTCPICGHGVEDFEPVYEA